MVDKKLSLHILAGNLITARNIRVTYCVPTWGQGERERGGGKERERERGRGRGRERGKETERVGEKEGGSDTDKKH